MTSPEDVLARYRGPIGAASLAGVLLAFFGFGLYRIPSVDIPWHLATGRLILAEHRFPVENTFSWTWPTWPLHQQYPVFQVTLALLVDHLGWPAVTVANALAWTLGLAAWMRWAGRWDDAARQPFLWLVVALGVQRHHVARPEVVTVLGIGLLLLGLDALRRGRAAGGVVVVLAQWLMVNGHQMWPLGLALQASFLLHLALSRALPGRLPAGLDVSPVDRDVPARPFLWTFAASVAVLMVSPLGPGVYLAPLTTLGTLLSQGAGAEGGAQARELMPVWSDPLSTGLLVLCTCALAFWLWRARRALVPFDLAVAAMGLALVAMAIRGMPFAALATGAVAARTRARLGPVLPDASPVHPVAAVLAALLGLRLVWVVSGAPLAFHRVQPGIGRTVGEWADRAVAFLRADPPPGEMLNVGWVAGNPLIGGLYPVKRVFVDPRWETYPRAFLLESIAASADPELFRAELAKWRPGFVVAEVPSRDGRARLAELVAEDAPEPWRLVYADSLLAVAVRETPEAADYLARHPPLDLDVWDPGDWVTGAPTLLAQQQIRVGALLRALGRRERGDALVALGGANADDPMIAASLEAAGAE